MTESQINLIITAIKELATVGALIYGLYLGSKSLRKYLLDDVIKRKTQRLIESNEKVEELTRVIISELDSIETINPVPTEDDYNYMKTKVKEIYDAALGGSKEINTICYYFMRSIQGASPDILKSQETRYPNYHEMLFNFALLVNTFASNLIPIPEKIKTIPFSSKVKKLNGIKIREEYKKLEKIEFGIDIDTNKNLFLRYVSLLVGSNAHFFYFRNFFRTVKDNTSLLLILHHNKLYLPLTLELNIILMPDPYLMLIKYGVFTEKNGSDNEDKEYILAYYSNLDNVHQILDDDLPKKIKPVNDPFGKDNYSIMEIVDSYNLLGPETLLLKIPTSFSRNYYSKVQRKVKKHLKKYYT